MSKARFEETIKKYMEKLDLSREEAIQLLEDEQADYIGEGEEYEKKANSIPKKRERKATTASKKPKEKERKVDEEKGAILTTIKPVIDGLGATNISIKTETELSFTLNDNSYTLKLTKHRKK